MRPVTPVALLPWALRDLLAAAELLAVAPNRDNAHKVLRCLNALECEAETDLGRALRAAAEAYAALVLQGVDARGAVLMAVRGIRLNPEAARVARRPPRADLA